MDTVVGVVANPIKGAYEGGLPGFGMGLVKGTLGLIARPAGAMIDVVTGTLNVVKRFSTDKHFRFTHFRFVTLFPYI